MVGQSPNSGPPEGRVGDSSSFGSADWRSMPQPPGGGNRILGVGTELPQYSPVMAGQNNDLQPQGLDTEKP